jgi:hypothetical protein
MYSLFIIYHHFLSVSINNFNLFSFYDNQYPLILRFDCRTLTLSYMTLPCQTHHHLTILDQTSLYHTLTLFIRIYIKTKFSKDRKLFVYISNDLWVKYPYLTQHYPTTPYITTPDITKLYFHWALRDFNSYPYLYMPLAGLVFFRHTHGIDFFNYRYFN